MAKIWFYEAVEKLVDDCAERGGAVYSIPGELFDSYILISPRRKATICRTLEFPRDNSYSIIFYNGIPSQVTKIMELLDEGEDERAAAMFWRR